MTMPRKEYPYVFEQTFTYTHSRGQAKAPAKPFGTSDLKFLLFSSPFLR